MWIINVQNMDGYYLVMEFIEGSVVNLVISDCIEKVFVFRKNVDVIIDLGEMNREEVKVYEKYRKMVGYGDKFVSVLKYRSEYVV